MNIELPDYTRDSVPLDYTSAEFDAAFDEIWEMDAYQELLDHILITNRLKADISEAVRKFFEADK